MDEILKCDHSNESYCAILSYNAVQYAVQDGMKDGKTGVNLLLLTFYGITLELEHRFSFKT